MAVAETFVPYAIDMNGSLIDQVQNHVVTAGLDQIILGGDGKEFNKYIATGTERQGMTFDTTAIVRALDIAAFAGIQVTAGAVLTMFFQATAEGSTRGGASLHTKVIMNEGILIPTGISMTSDQPGVISYAALATFDGTNEPFATTINQSLTGTPGGDEAFTVGPASANGSINITAIQSIDIDFGIQAQAVGGDGEGHVTYVYIVKVQPFIRVVTLDIETALNSLPLGAVKQDETPGNESLVYLRKIAEGAGRELDATAEHVSFKMNQGQIHTSQASATEDSEATATIVFSPVWDGTNDPFILDTSVAIT